MSDSAEMLAVLKARIATIAGERPSGDAALFTLGHAALDARLGGGMARGRLHELFAMDRVYQPCVTGFALMLVMRMGDGPVLWLRQDDSVHGSGRLNPPGLVDLGFDPTRIIEVQAPDEKALLRAAGDAARCPQLVAVLIEPWKAARVFTLTASRRLSIAAEKSGVTLFLLRNGADPSPSSAHSRWRVRAIPSSPLIADAPGHSTMEITLIRHRGGLAPFCQRLEWDRDQSIFRPAPLSGDLVSFPAGGAVEAGDADMS